MLRFLVPYLDEQKFAEQACLSVVELAHHRTLRQPNKAEFDRANRYQKDQTWVRPAKEK